MQEADEIEDLLDILASLAVELERGTRALAEGQAEGLEQSTERQQALCVRLSVLLPGTGRLLSGAQPDRDETSMTAHIRSAAAGVDVLYRRHAALLRLSRRSLRMWMALQRAHQGCLRPVFALGSGQGHSWSCEG